MQIGPCFWGGLCWGILSSEFRSALASGAVSAGPSLGVLAMRGGIRGYLKGSPGLSHADQKGGAIFLAFLKFSSFVLWDVLARTF